VGSDEVIVLDTNVVIWSIADPRRLSREAVRTMQRASQLFVPAITFWELAMLITRDRIRLGSAGFDEIVTRLTSDSRIQVQALSPAIGLRAAQLSLGQSMDPADQLIAATALDLDMPLVTSDERLRSLPGLRTIW
jgi:PIN domain nuclease of toxin-antitoxin system